MVKKPDLDAHLSPLDLAESELARARLDAAVLTRELLAFRIEKEVREANARLASLRNDQANNAKEITQAQKVAADLEVKLSKRYKVDLSKASYDSNTGKIHPGQG